MFRVRENYAMALAVTHKHNGLPLDRAPLNCARATKPAISDGRTYRDHEGGGEALALRVERVKISQQSRSCWYAPLGRHRSRGATRGRSSASAILALRATASSRFSFSSSTTSSGARAMSWDCPSFGIDAGNVGVSLLHFLTEARTLGGDIDHALERQRRRLAAHDELHRALRRRGRWMRCPTRAPAA